ncbi:phosphate/phosphite/phosphonate ABC transporter substrate-binding protein [Butyrivibrio sp. VCB2006]|uniref:phosphate/phosphite/phosphonate ABC transporter substrate-binding protein n=1 Tax=Butyrivibrio sp. VCB2006 TaxID=1280679 RepID=UPI0003F6E4CA|nr:PhnD/SsuA/transferrin family substrate-binding protein [Butyrivibrio sp. VCB2006]
MRRHGIGRIGISIIICISIAILAIGCGKKTTEITVDNGPEELIQKTPQENAIEETQIGPSEPTAISKLTVGFVPSQEPEEIVKSTEPLKDLLIEELAGFGYDVKEVEIVVGTSYESVGEGLSAGTIDVGFLPAGTYVLFDDGCDVILTATRDGLSIDSDDPKVWNEQKPTKRTTDPATYYRALIIAGPSDAGRAIAEKVNAGEEITFEELDALKWSIMDSSSPAGFVYPSLWFQSTYGKHITDLINAEVSDNYGTAFSKLAEGKIDVLVTYADARLDQEEKWNSSYGRTASIWDETDVIGVTDGIYNDTVCTSKYSPIMTKELKEAIKLSFINIGNTDAGKEAVAIYNHKGYVESTSDDYDSEREAQKLMMKLD